MGVDVQRWKMMRGVKVWRSRQVSVGYISSHAWRLPAVINVCLWVYALPLLLAVNVETLSDPTLTPVDMPPHYYKQLVASLIDLSTTEVAYLGTLIDKWLSWAPLWSKRCFSDEHLRRPPSGDTCLRGWRVPPVAFTFKYVVLLLLLLLSGDIELNPGPKSKLTVDDLGCVLEEIVGASARWYRLGLQLGVKTGKLDTIRAEFHNPEDQLTEMLKMWLKTSVDPSWKNLAVALKCESVGEDHLAGNLETKYCLLEAKEVDSSTSTSDSQSEASAITPPEFEPVVSLQSGVEDIQKAIECHEIPGDLQQYELHEVQVLDVIPLDISPCVLKKARHGDQECMLILYSPTAEHICQYFEYLRMCFQVEHDNVVKIHGICCFPDSPYPALVMEELEPLSHFVKNCDTISEKDQIRLVLDIIHAVSAYEAMPVLVQVVVKAIFVSSLQDIRAKFFPVFGCSYSSALRHTSKSHSSNLQWLSDIVVFLNGRGQPVERTLPPEHALEPVIRGWLQRSSPLSTVTEELEYLFQEESLRVATLEEFSSGNLIEVTHLHMILIGHTGVGKTSLVKHLKGEKIDPNENSTEVMQPQLLLCRTKQPDLLHQETLAGGLEGAGDTGYFMQESELYKAQPGKFYLTIWDTGGQPMFQDLLPCFAKLRSLYGVVFKLTEDLDKHPENDFRYGRQKHSTGPSPFSNKELIYRCLGYIEMFSSSIKDTIPNLPSEIVDILQLGLHEQVLPKAILIGTYKDQFEKSELESEKLLTRLVTFTESLEQVECLCSKTHYPTESPFQVAVHMIDNTKAGSRNEIDEGLEILVDSIRMLAKYTTTKFPQNWLHFKQRLEETCKLKYPNGILPYVDACDVAKECHISNVDAPLIYFHEVGAFLWYYYSDRTILKNYVILYPEKLLKVLATIFDAKGYGGSAVEWRKLKSKGILVEKLYTSCLDEQNTGISTQWVLDFLNEHHIACPIAHTDIGVGYFIPCMLPLCVEPRHLQAEPASSLYIILNAGYVPPGLFPIWVTILADQTLKFGKGRWVLCKPLFRNQVEFKVEDNYRVLLTEHSNYIQVECCPPPPESTPDPQVYRTVRSVLDICLFRSVPKWIYEREYRFTFACTMGADGNAHFLSELPLDPTCDVECSQHHTTRLKEGQLLWFGIRKTMQSIGDSTPTLPLLLSELLHVAYKWFNLGLYLVPAIADNIDGTLKNIQCSPDTLGRPVDCLRELLSCWLKKVHPERTWEGVVAALRNPVLGEERLAETLEQKYLPADTAPAQEQALHAAIHDSQDVMWRGESPSIKDLLRFKVVQSVAPMWYILGLYLELPLHRLHSIQVESRGDVEWCAIQMFQVWLKSSPRATLYELAKALRSVDMNAEADRIATLPFSH